jgi:hypothetical protein
LRAESGPRRLRPLLECGSVIEGKSLEEDPARTGGTGHDQSIDFKIARRQSYRVGLRDDSVRPETHAQPTQSLIQRVTGLRVVLIRPEEAEQVFPASRHPGGKRQIDQQSQVFPPQDIGRRHLAGEPGGRRPEVISRSGGGEDMTRYHTSRSQLRHAGADSAQDLS